MRTISICVIILASACTDCSSPPATEGEAPAPARRASLAQGEPAHAAPAAPALPPTPADPAPPAAAGEPAPAANAAAPGPVPIQVQIPGEEGPLTEWILERAAKVPETISGLSRERQQELHVDVDGLIFACNHHLKAYPANERRAEVATIFAEVLSMNRSRHLNQVFNEYKEATGNSIPIEEQILAKEDFVNRVFGAIDAAPKRPSPDPLLARRLLVRGETLQFSNQYREAVECYRKAIAEGLSAAREERAYYAIADAQRLGSDYSEARKTAQEFLARRSTSRHRPEMIYLEHQTYRFDGLIEEGIAHWLRYRSELEAGAAGKALPGVVLDGKPFVPPDDVCARYRSVAQRLHFYLGFYAFAKGDFEGAKGALHKFLGAAEEAVGAKQRAPETNVYVEFQALPYLATLDGLCGNEAPAVDLGDKWLRQAEESPAQPVRLLLFCGVHEAKARHERLVEALAKMSTEFEAEDLSITWVAGARDERRQPLEEQAAEFRAIVEKVGFDGAFGFDVGQEKQTYNAYMVNEGTTNLFAIDREGKVAWHVIDPMHWDEKLIRAVIQRLQGPSP
ncbi:MAG: hypothetical protein L0Z55_03185 [Planctomycetes bacterium]|nr:hypothetical protein [Planctomycetota bacterium]